MPAFDPFTPDHEPSNAPRWIQKIFSTFMKIVLVAIVFGAFGALAFLLPYRYPMGSSLVYSETAFSAWARFIVGGAIGTGLVAWSMMRRIKKL